MDDFKLQRALFRIILNDRPTVAKGMALGLSRLAASPHGQLWKQCDGIDWARGEQRWVRWFDALVKKHPLPDPTELLWFETPSELNPAMTSVSGYARIGPAGDRFGINEERSWPQDAKGNTLPAGLHDLPELEEAFGRVGWREAEDEAASRLLPAVYAISCAYAALLVLNGLPKTTLLSRRKGRGPVAVLLGWAGGDERDLGQLGPDGWAPIRRVRLAGPPDPEVLDPDSYKFDLKQYLAAGGDPDQRDSKEGATILMRPFFESFEFIDRLLAAGADPRAVDKQGKGVLHRLGATEIRTLRRLLDAGADPKLVDKSGRSVLDVVLDDGRCTLKHLELLYGAGARPRAITKEGATPLHALVAEPCSDPSSRATFDSLIRFWLARGVKINAPRRDGLPPLWVALQEHARQLEADLRAGIKSKEQRESGYSGHDQVAILLLKHGADPNARYRGKKTRFISEGATPLMVRCYDDDRLVRALLKHGADPLARCAKGNTALDYAEEVAADKRRFDRAGAELVSAVLRRAMMRSKPARPR
jgi:ankyrin repeat protein